MTRYTPSQALARPVRAPALPTLRRPSTLRRLRAVAAGLAQVGLVIAMAGLSVALWIASPIAWLWIAAHLTDSSHPGLGPYALLFGGILLTSIALTRVLAAADRAHQRLRCAPQPRVHRAWLRARGQEQRERPGGSPLGTIMVLSVLAAVVALVAFMMLSGHPFEPFPFSGAR